MAALNRTCLTYCLISNCESSPLHKQRVTAVNVNTMDPIILLTILTQALIEMTSSSQGILKNFIVIYKVQEVL